MSCRRTVPTPPITPKLVRPQHSNVLKSILPPYLGARLSGNQCIWSPKLSIKIIESFTWLKLLRMGLCGSCGHGFKSQAQHLHYFQCILLKLMVYFMLDCEKNENKPKEAIIKITSYFLFVREGQNWWDAHQSTTTYHLLVELKIKGDQKCLIEFIFNHTHAQMQSPKTCWKCDSIVETGWSQRKI